MREVKPKSIQVDAPKQIESRLSIPKHIHAIWLGSVLGQDGRDNLVNWKRINSDYEVKLWVDSALYGETEKREYEELKVWAKENNIVICDINPCIKETKDELAAVRIRYDIYENMLSKEFFDDEINGRYKNLAAASDILRVEILSQEGGIYIDAKDVFPGKGIGQLDTRYGFCCHIKGSKYINNDILASVAQGTVIREYRELIHERYQKLYQDEKELRAHRNPEFTCPDINRGDDPRKTTTQNTSGPGALDAIISALQTFGVYIPEADLRVGADLDEHIAFNHNLFALPPHEAASWYDPKANTKFEKVVPILRNYVREHFNDVINIQCEFIKAELKKFSECKEFDMFGIRNIKIQSANTLLSLFIALKSRLNALPTNISMDEVYQNCIRKLSDQEIRQINISCDHIISKIFKCSKTLEELIKYCEKNVEPDQLATMLSKLGKKIISIYKLNEFVADILLNTEGDKPNIDKLKLYGIKAFSTEYKADHSSSIEGPSVFTF